MTRLYLDTEFTALRLDRQLISLALVSSTGAEFYVELLDDWAPEACRVKRGTDLFSLLLSHLTRHRSPCAQPNLE